MAGNRPGTYEHHVNTLRGQLPFYVRGPDGRPVNSPPVDISYKSGGGGMLSTPEDLTRLGSALLTPGFLRPDTLQAMTTPMTDAAEEPTGYGMGWTIRQITEYGRGLSGDAVDPVQRRCRREDGQSVSRFRYRS